MAKRKTKKNVLFRRWTLAEVRILKRYYSTRSTREVAAMLPRTAAAVGGKARTLGLYKQSQQWWTPEEIKRLKKYYPNMSNCRLAEKMGRTTKSVATKAYTLGLHKTKKYLRRVARKSARL